MRTAACVLIVLVAASSTSTGRAGGAEKTDVDPAKLVGVWKLVDVGAENPPLGMPVEFTAGGEALYVGGDDPVPWGRYKVRGGRLEVTIVVGGEAETNRYAIEKLTDADLL